MRLYNKFNDDIGSLFDYSRKELYLMFKYKEVYALDGNKKISFEDIERL